MSLIKKGKNFTTHRNQYIFLKNMISSTLKSSILEPVIRFDECFIFQNWSLTDH